MRFRDDGGRSRSPFRPDARARPGLAAWSKRRTGAGARDGLWTARIFAFSKSTGARHAGRTARPRLCVERWVGRMKGLRLVGFHHLRQNFSENLGDLRIDFVVVGIPLPDVVLQRDDDIVFVDRKHVIAVSKK